MIIFGLIFTTFESSSIFRVSWDSIENWLEPKTEPSLKHLACTNPWNTQHLLLPWQIEQQWRIVYHLSISRTKFLLFYCLLSNFDLIIFSQSIHQSVSKCSQRDVSKDFHCEFCPSIFSRQYMYFKHANKGMNSRKNLVQNQGYKSEFKKYHYKILIKTYY